MKLQNILEWSLVLFILYLIYEIIRKLLGGSLGFEELVIGLLLANLGYAFHTHTKLAHVQAKLAEHLGWHKGKETKT